MTLKMTLKYTLPFTERAVGGLKVAPGNRQTDYYDESTVGFGVRIHRNAAGRVSRQYFVRYRFHGKRRRYLLGTTPPMSLREAPAEGRRVHEVAGRGVDPREDPDFRRG